MLRMSVSEMTTYRWSLEQDLVHYQEAAFSALGVWRQKLSDYGEDDAVRLMDQVGLEVSSLAWAGGFTGSDGRSHPDSISDGRDALELARALKAPCLITHIGSRWGHTANHARRLVCQALERLLPTAEELDIVLALEPMHADCAAEWTFLTTIDQTLELMRELASSHVKIVFDAYHMGHDQRNLDRLAELIPDLALVQLADARRPPQGEVNRCCLGEGILPLPRIVHELLEGGYEGYWEVELLGEDVECLSYEQILRRCRSWLGNLAPADAAAWMVAKRRESRPEV